MRFALALAVAGAVAVAATTAYGRGTAGGVPRGFEPETAAAIGTRDYWVFGDYRCRAGWCLALLRSTHAGEDFTRLAAPPLTSQGTVPTLVFANARDGYAYTWTRSPLYVTHDGGTSWQREPGGTAIAVAVGRGQVYAVTGRCSDTHGCRSFHLRRSSVTRTHWHSLTVPVRSGLPYSLAVRGDHLWLLGEPDSGTNQFDRLARSTDGGQAFTVRKGPCYADLGGRIVPAGNGVVWAVCPTGMLAGLLLSTNGGRSFPAVSSFHDPGGVHRPTLTNGARLAAASARVAVMDGGGGGSLLRTTDAGRHWNLVSRTARIRQAFWLGFSTSRVGAALVQTGAHQVGILRTTDGGATWHSVPIR